MWRLLAAQHILDVAGPVADMERARRPITGQDALTGVSTPSSLTMAAMIPRPSARPGAARARSGNENSWQGASARPSTIPDGLREQADRDEHEQGQVLVHVAIGGARLGRQRQGDDSCTVQPRHRQQVEDRQPEVCELEPRIARNEPVPDRKPGTQSDPRDRAEQEFAAGPARPRITGRACDVEVGGIHRRRLRVGDRRRIQPVAVPQHQDQRRQQPGAERVEPRLRQNVRRPHSRGVGSAALAGPGPRVLPRDHADNTEMPSRSPAARVPADLSPPPPATRARTAAAPPARTRRERRPRGAASSAAASVRACTTPAGRRYRLVAHFARTIPTAGSIGSPFLRRPAPSPWPMALARLALRSLRLDRRRSNLGGCGRQDGDGIVRHPRVAALRRDHRAERAGACRRRALARHGRGLPPARRLSAAAPPTRTQTTVCAAARAARRRALDRLGDLEGVADGGQRLRHVGDDRSRPPARARAISRQACGQLAGVRHRPMKAPAPP